MVTDELNAMQAFAQDVRGYTVKFIAAAKQDEPYRSEEYWRGFEAAANDYTTMVISMILSGKLRGGSR